ncbi:hypothetical protein AT267_01325 [Bacillus cereus]|nr:hypothetical protein AT267_01325 [Bacillus cereus]
MEQRQEKKMLSCEIESVICDGLQEQTITRVEKEFGISVNGTGPNPKGDGRIRSGHVRSMYHPLGSFLKHVVWGTPTGEGASQEWEVGGWMFGLRSKGLPLVVVWGRNPKVFVTLWRNLAKPKRLAEPFHCVRITEWSVTIQKRLLCESNKALVQYNPRGK